MRREEAEEQEWCGMCAAVDGMEDHGRWPAAGNRSSLMQVHMLSHVWTDTSWSHLPWFLSVDNFA